MALTDMQKRFIATVAATVLAALIVDYVRIKKDEN